MRDEISRINKNKNVKKKRKQQFHLRKFSENPDLGAYSKKFWGTPEKKQDRLIMTGTMDTGKVYTGQ